MKPKSEESGKIQIYNAQTGQVETLERVVKPDAEWKKILTPEQFDIMRRKGTERAFSKPCAIPRSGEGVYQCAGCGTDLFAYGKKFDSGTGWPSFFGPVSPLNVRLEEDSSFGMHRTEVLCARCGAHLGHVFDDGPGANAPGPQSGSKTGRFAASRPGANAPGPQSGTETGRSGAIGPPPTGKRYCINTLALRLNGVGKRP